MIRALLMIVGCVCIAVMLCEGGVLFVMWRKGMLSAHNLHEIKMILTQAPGESLPETEIAKNADHPSAAQIAELRATRLYDFDKREVQLQAMKTMTDDRAADLDQRVREFQAHKKTFEEGLATLQKSISATAVEQARGVVLALPPRDAVEKLMTLSLPEDVLLLKGMSEKAIARLLPEFNANPEQVDRGRKIFEAISRGDPLSNYVRNETKSSRVESPAEAIK